MNNNKIKVALIGYGHLGVWHAQKCEQLDNSELFAIVESYPPNMEKAKVAHPNCLVVSKLEEVLDEIDAALVVTPTSVHFEVCRTLIENNKHVFCEKPFTATFEEAKKLEKLAKSKDVTIQVGHSERFHKVWDMKNKYPEFFEGPASVLIQRCAPFKGRATDVSVVSDLMIHDLDLTHFLFAEKPTSLRSHGYKIRTNEYDYVSTTLYFDSKKEVNIINSRNDTFEKRSLTIVNKFGTLYFDLLNFEFSVALGSATDSDHYVQNNDYAKSDHLLIEQELFYESILNKTSAVVSIDDGVKIVELISKVHESLESGDVLPLNIS